MAKSPQSSSVLTTRSSRICSIACQRLHLVDRLKTSAFLRTIGCLSSSSLATRSAQSSIFNSKLQQPSSMLSQTTRLLTCSRMLLTTISNSPLLLCSRTTVNRASINRAMENRATDSKASASRISGSKTPLLIHLSNSTEQETWTICLET